MATTRKRWPNWASWARDDAIMELHIASGILREVINEDGKKDELQQLRSLTAALNSVHDALKQLERVQ